MNSHKLLRWTAELPTKPGWYWFKFVGVDYTPQDRKPQIVEIKAIAGLRFCDGRLPNEIKAWPGHWAGPIAKPEAFNKGSE